MADLDWLAISFAAPQYLWLLVPVVALVCVWLQSSLRQTIAIQRFAAHRIVPLRERFPLLGDLSCWLWVGLAAAFLVLALARPTVATSRLQTAGVDVVILQDGSSSMAVADVPGNRWQRSMRFLRVLGESLRWKDDRLAMSVFAHIAAPQVRLTKDPNTFFFFLDHLDQQSPFRLEDDTTWDTNIELGIHWGLRQIERDEELNGRKPTGKIFVLLTDGQTWSGEVEKSIGLARARQIPIMVVGVGTSAGGYIPTVSPGPDGTVPASAPLSPIRSTLDRESLIAIATNANGRYLELDREGDRAIANTIIEAARQRAGSRGVEPVMVDMYWNALAAAAACLAVAVLVGRDRTELWLQLLGTTAAFAAVVMWTR